MFILLYLYSIYVMELGDLRLFVDMRYGIERFRLTNDKLIYTT